MERNPDKILKLIMEHMSFLKLESDLDQIRSLNSSKSIDQQLSDIEQEIRELEERELAYFKKDGDDQTLVEVNTEQVKFHTYPSRTLGTIIESPEEGSSMSISTTTKYGKRPLSEPVLPKHVDRPTSQLSLDQNRKSKDLPHPCKSKSFVKENRVISVCYQSDSDCSESDTAAWD